MREANPFQLRERLEEVVRQLSGIGGSRTLGFGPNRVRSLPDGVGQALEEYLSGKKKHRIDELEADPNILPDLVEVKKSIDQQKKMGDLCSECGEPSMVNEEGCRKCYSCGYSEC